MLQRSCCKRCDGRHMSTAAMDGSRCLQQPRFRQRLRARQGGAAASQLDPVATRQRFYSSAAAALLQRFYSRATAALQQSRRSRACSGDGSGWKPFHLYGAVSSATGLCSGSARRHLHGPPGRVTARRVLGSTRGRIDRDEEDERRRRDERGRRGGRGG